MPHFTKYQYLFFALWVACLIYGTVKYSFHKRKKFRKIKKDRMVAKMIAYSEKPTTA